MKKNYASPEQVLAAFESLPDADLLAIRAVAARYIRGTRYTEPADLIHEVLDKCMQGTRHWPMNVPLGAFINEAMKSIALADRATKEHTHVVHLDTGGFDALDQDLMSAHISFMNPQELCEAKQLEELGKAKISALKQAFSDDPIAKILIVAWSNNVQTKDVLTLNNISKKDYDAARKRIARRLESQLPTTRRLQ
ncbi:hypothetical protein [Acidovorax sp.]|uniref:hypothetical protein n=1 Tax=Acidovorax sp. TaxID=1872122 RepID=UPI00258C9EED|nr:hypothetical protein [Acidovorax sp.]